jgi:LysM repeat protein
VIVLVASTLGGGGGGSSGSGGGSGGTVHLGRGGGGTAHTPKSYIVKNGDTLSSIAHEMGVPVARILRLNPGVDPQILIAGEKLRLR